MSDQAILEIKQVNGLSLSTDKTWQGGSNVYVELYRELVTSGMLAEISGNALKVLVALGLRARVLGGRAEDEDLFRHLRDLKLVTEADRGQLCCYATKEDLQTDCGFGSNNTVGSAIKCLSEHGLVEQRSRPQVRQPKSRKFIANVYLIRPAASIRKFGTGYEPSDLGVQKMHSQNLECAENAHPNHGGSAENALPDGSGHARSAHNKKEDKEGDEDDDVVFSFFLAACADAGQPRDDPLTEPERAALRELSDLGYSADDIKRIFSQTVRSARRGTTITLTQCIRSVRRHWHRHRPTNAWNTGRNGLPRNAPPAADGECLRTPATTGDNGLPANAAPAGSACLEAAAPTDDDELMPVYELLQAASVRDVESQADVVYDRPGIRVGLHGFLSDGYTPEEIYEAVMATVSRCIAPDRLVSYTRAVLKSTRQERRETEWLHVAVEETARTTGPPDQSCLFDTDAPESPERAPLRLWEQALGELELQMTKATFNTWLKSVVLASWTPTNNGTPAQATLSVPNDYVADWLRNRLITPIRRTLSGIAGEEVEVKFVVEETYDDTPV